MAETPLTRDAGIRVPLICGAMYPCSNPELVAAVSEAGGIGIVQPMSLVYVLLNLVIDLAYTLLDPRIRY